MRLGRCTRSRFARFTVLWVVQGPHAGPVVVIGAPEVLFTFKGLHERIVLLTVVFLGIFVLPCPLV